MKLIATLIIALATAGTAGAVDWRVTKSGSINGGMFGVKAITATVTKPAGLAVRLGGDVETGNAVVSCARNLGVASWSREYRKAGLYVLPMTIKADTCVVVVSVGGSGRLTVQILRR